MKQKFIKIHENGKDWFVSTDHIVYANEACRAIDGKGETLYPVIVVNLVSGKAVWFEKSGAKELIKFLNSSSKVKNGNNKNGSQKHSRPTTGGQMGMDEGGQTIQTPAD